MAPGLEPGAFLFPDCVFASTLVRVAGEDFLMGTGE